MQRSSRSTFVRRHSARYNFVGDRRTGLTFRWGRHTVENPERAPWPELADISISNRCSKVCDYCYRESTPDGPLMTIDEYGFVLDQLTSDEWGPPFQVAIGGGEPTQHPQLIDILEETTLRAIVANLTTNGASLCPELVKGMMRFCGAVAVSVGPDANSGFVPAIQMLTRAGVRTNVHFILSRDTVGTAIEILAGKWDTLLTKINAVIFLTYKSLGRASADGNLQMNGELRRFLECIDHPRTRLRLGFDACFVPLLLKFTNVDRRFIDSCECGFFSVFVDENLDVRPCSFTTGTRDARSLREIPFSRIWDLEFEEYRNRARKACQEVCNHREDCRGGCVYHEAINLCKEAASR